MKILVIGREGQLARSLAERGKGSVHDLVCVGRPEFDLSDPDTIRREVARHAPDLVLNAAAYTAVDRAEDEPEIAHAVNGVAPGLIAAAALENEAALIHVSTDYVFDGTGDRPLDEATSTAPLGVYGHTKLVGEEAVRATISRHAVVRTAWVYSPFGANFVKTMLRLAADRDEIRVVGDQVGSPTSAIDLADGLLALAARWADNAFPKEGRTYHLAGGGQATWAELAAHVLDVSGEMGGPTATVIPITTAEYPTRATRPAWSVLDSSSFAAATGFRMPEWRDSVAETVRRLLKEAV